MNSSPALDYDDAEVSNASRTNTSSSPTGSIRRARDSGTNKAVTAIGSTTVGGRIPHSSEPRLKITRPSWEARLRPIRSAVEPYAAKETHGVKLV